MDMDKDMDTYMDMNTGHDLENHDGRRPIFNFVEELTVNG
jgi:hypothetical protein